jgi:uncharacterized protein (DUF1015 family)
VADVQPFLGITYDPERVDLGSVLSAPYDVINPEQQAAYYDRDPHNAVRIVLNRAEGDGRYEAAASDLRAWLADGVLRRDAAPALYVHRHTFAAPDGAGRLARLGLIAAVRLEPWATGAVKPHEHTMPGPKEDRLKLLQATAADTEPIWVFHPDLGDAMTSRLKRIVKTEPTLAADFSPVPGAGEQPETERHELWRIDEPREVKELATVASEMQLYIADGHHRYETALHHAELVGGGPDDPSRFKLMLLSPLEDPGLLVLPTHRLVRPADGYNLGTALETLAQRGWKWVPASDTAGLLDMLRATPAPNHIGFGLYANGRRSYHEGIVAGPEVELLPKAVAALDVALIHHGILAPLLGVGEAELAAGSHVAYARDAGEVIGRVDSGELDFGLLLRPPTLAQIQAVADAGESMPQKSTYFWPKPASGLVMALQSGLSEAGRG